MNITRVIRDCVEFFTIDATDKSKISESRLANLCGVSHQVINKTLRNLVAPHSEANGLKAKLDGKVWLKPRGLSTIERSKITNLSIVRASACAAIIEHYAFDSKYKTEEARFNYFKLAELGITAWIQSLTDWRSNPIPTNGITLDFDPIGHIIAKSRAFPTHPKRLHLFSHEQPRLDPIEEVCTECNIKVSFEIVKKESTKSQNKTTKKPTQKTQTLLMTI
jgi:hypothetical protein